MICELLFKIIISSSASHRLFQDSSETDLWSEKIYFIYSNLVACSHLWYRLVWTRPSRMYDITEQNHGLFGTGYASDK